MVNKTVYILGAGASFSAHLPTQAGLLPLIFGISKASFDDVNLTNEKDFLSLTLDTSKQEIENYYQKFDAYRQELGEFIVINFGSSDKLKQYTYALEMARSEKTPVHVRENFLSQAYAVAKSINVTLEDLFTIFDNVDSGREHFRLYSPEKMIGMHKRLKLCIIYALSFKIATECDMNDYKRFSDYLVRSRLKTAQKEDSFSIITMNWDDLLERTLNDCCSEYNHTLNKGQQKIYPDLCFYNDDLNSNASHIPSTTIKAKGHKNIKILKMHGSLAWLECPRCGRIFTDFSSEIAFHEFADMPCPRCMDGYLKAGDEPVLRSLIITPTFMKSLDNLYLKNIWHNAYIDVSEADRLVFIGYSFPDADFEMRCLLKKAIRTSATIKVILAPSDNPEKYFNDFKNRGYEDSEAHALVNRMYLPAVRYQSFFGEDKTTFYYGGFGDYLDEVSKE